MKKTTIFILLLLIFQTAWGIPFAYLYEDETFLYSQSPAAEWGTHSILFGLSNGLGYSIPLEIIPEGFVGIESHVEVLYHQQKLGIPGDDYQFEGSLFFHLGLGGRPEFPAYHYLFPGIAAHTFSYYWGYYGAGDGTSQPTGGWQYRYSGKKVLLKAVYENDWFGLLFSDQFRTAAVVLQARYKIGPLVPGIEAGFKLWVGKKDGLSPLRRGGVYDFSGQFGSEYSHGILFFSLLLNELKLTLGYDSEAIREVIQNTIHWIVDDGAIPALDRPDRFYFQIGVSSEGLVY